MWGRWMVILQWNRDPIVRAYAWCVWPGFRDFVCLACKRSYYLFTPSFAQFDGWIPLKRCLSGNAPAPATATATSHSRICFFSFFSTKQENLVSKFRLVCIPYVAAISHICPRTCTHIHLCAWTVITPAFDLFGWQNANVKLQHTVPFRSILSLCIC